MVQINFAQKQINAKIVYYGPGMSGKTTNLEVGHQRAAPLSQARGVVIVVVVVIGGGGAGQAGQEGGELALAAGDGMVGAIGGPALAEQQGKTLRLQRQGKGTLQ